MNKILIGILIIIPLTITIGITDFRYEEGYVEKPNYDCDDNIQCYSFRI